MSKEMPIGEIAKRIGIESSAIRYYESMGLLSPPARSGGKRRYSEDAVLTLQRIQLAKETGFTIQEIKEVFKARHTVGRGAWRPFAVKKLEELDVKMEKIKMMKKLLGDVLSCACGESKTCTNFQSKTE